MFFLCVSEAVMCDIVSQAGAQTVVCLFVVMGGFRRPRVMVVVVVLRLRSGQLEPVLVTASEQVWSD